MNGMAARRRAVLWSPEALNDLNDIWDYYAGVAGSPTANKLLRDIGDVAATLEEHPFAGRVRDEIRSGLHSFATGPHVIFYRVVDDRPEIVRVLDGRRDLDEIFSDDPR
jgi:toxin ParE1/3/4